MYGKQLNLKYSLVQSFFLVDKWQYFFFTQFNSSFTSSHLKCVFLNLVRFLIVRPIEPPVSLGLPGVALDTHNVCIQKWFSILYYIKLDRWLYITARKNNLLAYDYWSNSKSLWNRDGFINLKALFPQSFWIRWFQKSI